MDNDKTIFYMMERWMPYRPKEVVMQRYVLPCTLKDEAEEEAAARLISLSQKFGDWVGVRATYLTIRMYDDQRHYSEWWLAIMREQRRFRRRRLAYGLLCYLTLGAIKLFARPEYIPLPRPKNVPLRSLVYDSLGFCQVMEAWDRLEERGLVNFGHPPKRPDLLVVFPTAKLLRAVRKFDQLH